MELDRDSILRAAAEAAEQMNEQPAVPGVSPQPVPTSVQLSTARNPQGNDLVVLVLSTPVGQNVYFFDTEAAEKIADGIKETARFARTGLEIAR